MFLKYVTDVSPPEGGREGRGRPSKGAAGQKSKSALRGFKKIFEPLGFSSHIYIEPFGTFQPYAISGDKTMSDEVEKQVQLALKIQKRDSSVAYRAKRPKDMPMAPVTKALTRKQELFVKEIVSKDGQITARQAAINAGFAPASAHQSAHRMMNPRLYPNIAKKIREYRSELDEMYGITFERHLRDLQIIRDEALANGKYSAAVQAEVRRGMAHGNIYVSKSEIRHGSIDSMSKEEVLRAIQELGGSVIDVTPNENPGKQTLGVPPAGSIEDADEVDDDED